MLKRLRKTVRLVAAWMCVCLMLVDPAAACRLLAGRRCCRPCPTPCSDVTSSTVITTDAASIAPEESTGIAAAPLTVPHEANPAVDEIRPLVVVDREAQEPAPAAPPAEAAPVPPHEEPATPTEVAAAEIAPQLPVREAPAQDVKEESKPEMPPSLPRVDNELLLPTPPANEAPKQPEPDPDDPFAPLPPKKPLEQKGAAAPPAKSASDPAKSTAYDEEISLAWRQWTDDSGQFRVKARLVLVLDGKVRLLKDTGRTTTVPIERLSSADRTYVSKVVARYGNDLSKEPQFAQWNAYRHSSP